MVVIDSVVRLLPGVLGNETVGGYGFFQHRFAGVSALYPSGGISRLGGAGCAACPAIMRMWSLAARAIAAAHAGSGGRSCWRGRN